MQSPPEPQHTDPLPDEPDERPAFAEDGTDLTLIRWFLTKTPEERLLFLQSWIDSIQELRDAAH